MSNTLVRHEQNLANDMVNIGMKWRVDHHFWELRHFYKSDYEEFELSAIDQYRGKSDETLRDLE